MTSFNLLQKLKADYTTKIVIPVINWEIQASIKRSLLTASYNNLTQVHTTQETIE